MTFDPDYELGVRDSEEISIPPHSWLISVLLWLTLIAVFGLFIAYLNMGTVENAVQSIVTKVATMWKLD